MNTRTAYVIGVIGIIAAGALFYWRRSKQIEQQAATNPGASTDASLGNIIRNSTYQASTGQIGDTRTENQEYDAYLDWLKQGGNQSGTTWPEYYTEAQSNSLPTNS